MIVPARQLVAKRLRIMSTLRFRVRALGVPLPVVRMAKASGSHNSHARAFRWWSALGGDKSAIWRGGSATGVLAPRGRPAPAALQRRVPDTYPAYRHSQHRTVPESVLTKVCAGGCLATYTKARAVPSPITASAASAVTPGGEASHRPWCRRWHRRCTGRRRYAPDDCHTRRLPGGTRWAGMRAPSVNQGWMP